MERKFQHPSTYLHTLEKQRHDVRASHKLFDVGPETLSQAAQQVQSHNHEILIRSLILIWMLVVHLDSQNRVNVKVSSLPSDT